MPNIALYRTQLWFQIYYRAKSQKRPSFALFFFRTHGPNYGLLKLVINWFYSFFVLFFCFICFVMFCFLSSFHFFFSRRVGNSDQFTIFHMDQSTAVYQPGGASTALCTFTQVRKYYRQFWTRPELLQTIYRQDRVLCYH